MRPHAVGQRQLKVDAVTDQLSESQLVMNVAEQGVEATKEDGAEGGSASAEEIESEQPSVWSSAPLAVLAMVASGLPGRSSRAATAAAVAPAHHEQEQQR